MRAALGVAVALAAVGAAALLAAGRMLVVADPLPPRADAIVILGGSIPDRTLAAADLYRAGLAPRVVVTREVARTGQAALDARGVRLPEDDELTVTALRGLGVPSRAIVVLRRRGISTDSEARTMSHPPMSFPPTYTCGIVGQLEKRLIASRFSGSASTSIALKGTPTSLSTCTVAAEKPHIGKLGVPFM